MLMGFSRVVSTASHPALAGSGSLCEEGFVDGGGVFDDMTGRVGVAAGALGVASLVGGREIGARVGAVTAVDRVTEQAASKSVRVMKRKARMTDRYTSKPRPLFNRGKTQMLQEKRMGGSRKTILFDGTRRR